jgi:hypothetical protein
MALDPDYVYVGDLVEAAARRRQRKDRHLEPGTGWELRSTISSL